MHSTPQFTNRFAARGRDHSGNPLGAMLAGAPAVLPLHKISETATTITLGWPAQGAGCIGFEFTTGDKRSNTWNGATVQARFTKGKPITVTALGASAVGTWPQAAPPPTGKLKGLWDGNDFADIVRQADTGFNTLFTGDTSLIPQMKALGLKANIQSGHWRGEDNTYSVDVATAVAWAKPFHDAGILRQMYLADEPDINQYPTSPTVIRTRYEALKSAYPDVEMVMGFWDGGDGSHIAPFKDCCDLALLDIYPVNNNTYDAYSIPAVADACHKLGLPFAGVIQMFKSEQWQLPTVASLNRLIDQWVATPQIGVYGYAWGNSDGSTALADQFQQHNDLVAALKERLAAI